MARILIALAIALPAFVVPLRVSDALWGIIGDLLGLFLVSMIALPQTIAFLTLKDELRRLVSSVLDWRYKAFLIVLVMNIIMVLAAQGSSRFGFIPPWVDRSFANRVVVFLFIYNTIYLVLYFWWLLPRISSPSEVLAHFRDHIIKQLRKGEGPEQILSDIENLIGIGKDAEAGHETGLAIKELLRLAKAILEQPEDQTMNRYLPSILEGLAEVVCAGQVTGDDANGVEAIKALEELYEIAREAKSNFDYGRFAVAVSKITNFAVAQGYTKAASQGIQVLKRICESRIQRREEQTSIVAYHLAEIGVLCTQQQDFDGAVKVASQLSSLLETARKTNLTNSYAFLFHTLSVYAYIWESKPYAKPAFEPFTKNLKDFRGLIHEALDYGKAIAPIRAALVEKFITAIGSLPSRIIIPGDDCPAYEHNTTTTAKAD